MVRAEMQSFWADFIHFAACPFPGAEGEMGWAQLGLWGCQQCAHECVSVSLNAPERVRGSACVCVKCACECAQDQARRAGRPALVKALRKPTLSFLSLCLALITVIVRGVEGRSKEVVEGRAGSCSRRIFVISLPEPFPLCSQWRAQSLTRGYLGVLPHPTTRYPDLEEDTWEEDIGLCVCFCRRRWIHLQKSGTWTGLDYSSFGILPPRKAQKGLNFLPTACAHHPCF